MSDGCFSVFARCQSGGFLEYAVEVLRILESQFHGNLVHRLLRSQYQLLCVAYESRLYVFLRRYARLFLYHVTEVVWREEHLVGEVFHRRQTVCHGALLAEVVVEEVLELHYHALVALRARDELPFVEPHAVVEQQFDVARDEPAAVLVSRTAYFHLYFFKTVGVDAFLFVRQVQRFVGRIREKGVTPYVLSERRALYEVGVEEQSERVELHSFGERCLHHLPRSEACHRPLLVVVGLSSVEDVPAHEVFQKQGIQPVVEYGAPHGLRLCLRKAHYAYERMQRLHSEQCVVFLHAVYLYDVFHNGEWFCVQTVVYVHKFNNNIVYV